MLVNILSLFNYEICIVEFHSFVQQTISILDQYSNDINALCASHRVKHLYAFGSVLTDNFNTNSDIDFIVDFEAIEVVLYADNYFDLKFSLAELLHRPIDLLEEQYLKNPYFKQSIDQTRKLVYGC